MLFLFESITTFLNALLCILLIQNKEKTEFQHIGVKFVPIIVTMIFKLMVDFVEIPILNFLFSFLIIFTIIKMMGNIPIRTTILYTSAFLMVILAADVLGAAITSTILNRTLSITVEGEGMTIMHFFMNWILQVIFVRIIAILLRKHSYTKLKWLEIVFYFFLTLFEVGVFAYVSNSVQESTSGSFLIVMMIGFLVLDLYMMYILHQVSHIREAENKIALMQQQSKLQFSLYHGLQDRYDHSIRVIHDEKTYYCFGRTNRSRTYAKSPSLPKRTVSRIR